MIHHPLDIKTVPSLVGLMILALALALSSPGRTATDDEIAVARRLFAEAEKAQKAERWQEAVEKLERVIAIKETAGVRFHLAICYENLGKLVKALEGFERAKALAVETEAGDVLDMVGSEIERLRSRVGGVKIQLPDGVGPMNVHVDQAVHANLPPGENVRLDPGTHQVIVKIGGKVRLDRLVSVDEGQHETLRVKDWRPKPEAADRDARTTEPVVDRSKDGGALGIPTSAWISFGAAAALGVGGYLAYDKSDSLAQESADVCAESIRCDPARADAVRRWDTVALGMWIGTAVGVGTGVALTIAHDDRRGEDTAVVVSPSQVRFRTRF